MRVAEIDVPQIDRQRDQIHKGTDGILSVKNKIAERENAADGANFPKSKRNHALFSPLGSEPLEDKSYAKCASADPADDLPFVDDERMQVITKKVDAGEER